MAVIPVTVSVQAHDDLNSVDFFKTRTFQVYVDNEFERWTRSVAVQFDVAPPAGGRIYYSEIRNASTGESDVWALAVPLGAPEKITQSFWDVTSPTAQSDGPRVVFSGRRRASDPGPSLWLVPPTGGDTTTALPVVRWNASDNSQLGGPRFAPSGPMLLYHTDSLGINYARPKPWVRDVSNFASPPVPLVGEIFAEASNAYVNGAWKGSADSIVVESYTDYQFLNIRRSRGLYKMSVSDNTASTFPQWLADSAATDLDWSPDGHHIVFAKRAPGRTDRDLWIINANSSDRASAVPVTRGIADEFHPRFSSDGTKIFFVSNRVDQYGANGVYDTERRGTNIWSVSRFDRP
jgi:Tol biopolymer transport system component